MKYRGVATHPEVDAAIEDIVNEAITASELKPSVAPNSRKVFSNLSPTINAAQIS